VHRDQCYAFENISAEKIEENFWLE
jgi:hypothetical protein